MAGEWIKMRGNLWDDPRVARLCDITDQPEAMIVGALYWLWATADQHTADGIMPGLTTRAIDRKTGVPGFGQALCDIGWLADHPEGVRIVGFEEHNGISAKKRCQTAKRVAAFKAGNAQETQESADGNAASVTKALAERDLEKRREEKNSLPTVEREQRATRLPADWVCPLEWWEWARDARPDLDVLAAAEKFRDYWVGIGGAKGRKVDWQATWRNWVREERGSVGNRGSSPPSETAYARQMREKYQLVAPGIAAKRPGAANVPTNVIDMEPLNAIR